MLNFLNRGAEGRYQTEFGRFGKGLSLTQKTEIEASGLPGLEFTNIKTTLSPWAIRLTAYWI